MDTKKKVDQFLKHFGQRFKEYRCTLYNKHVKNFSQAEAVDRRPETIHPNDWMKLVAYWMTPEFQVYLFIIFNYKYII